MVDSSSSRKWARHPGAANPSACVHAHASSCVVLAVSNWTGRAGSFSQDQAGDLEGAKTG